MELPLKTDLIFKNNRAYTTDHVLVRKIRVTYDMMGIYDLYDYFLQFGAIEKFETAYESKPYRKQGEKRIYITYVEPEAACKAIFNTAHYLQCDTLRELVLVSQAHSWQQPEREKAVRIGEEIEASNQETKAPTTNQGLNLLQLPVLCIEAILDRLEVSDQIRLVRANRNLEFLFRSFCRRRYKKFDLTQTNKMTLWDINEFIGIAGQYMVEISGELEHSIGDYVIDTLTDFCPHLECVSLMNTKIKQDTLKHFFRNLKNLRELNLTHCYLGDTTLYALRGAEKLRTMNLKNLYISGKFVHTVTQTEHLSLRSCHDFCRRYLIRACKMLQNLRSLDIRDVIYYKPLFYDVIDQICQQLEILKMSEPPYDYERVALLPRLKHLEVAQFMPDLGVQIIPKLVQHKADQLEVFKIDFTPGLTGVDITNISKLHKLKILSIAGSWHDVTYVDLAQLGELKLLEDLTIAGCDILTNEYLLRLLKKLPNLHTLNIQFCEQITNDFIETIALMLRDSWRKFKIYTYCTSVNRELLLQSPAFKEPVERFGLKIMYEFKDTES